MSATILCVHEDRAVARLHAEALEAEGYEVLCAHDGRQTLDILRRRQPDFAVLDARLPRQDGFEILAEMRMLPAHEQTPVLLLAKGDVSQEMRDRAKALGAVAVENAPIAPTHLIACVARHVKASAGEVASKLPIQGKLRDIPVPELLSALWAERHTGVLLLEHGKKKKAVEFRDGWPIAVKSNLVSECLGSFLVAQGRCSREALDESIKRMRAGEGLQGQILVAMEVLDEDEMVALLEAHAHRKLYEIFSWQDGAYESRKGVRLQRGSSLGIHAHPAKLIVEGVCSAYPLKRIDRYFERQPGAFVVPHQSASESVTHAALPDEASKWVASLDGSTSVASILEAPEWVRRLAFGLVSIEFLTIEGAVGDEQEAREAVGQVHGEGEAEAIDEASLRSELADLANRIRSQDHYGVLGVGRDATDEQIAEAHARLTRQSHPDRFHDASSSIRELARQVNGRIQEAFRAISSADRRARYANEQTQSQRRDDVEDEGRRALMAETAYQKGEAKLAARDYEGALLCYGRAMENFPGEGEYRAAYGWCLYLCHPDNDVMLNEALEHCRAGLKLAKDREKPYLLLGRLYKAMGRAGAARKMFSRAVEIQPQCVEAMRELRIMNMRREKQKGVLKRLFRR
jgi:CheY-like chemotaxis protein/tetratricopeptide (TPR) repeat protein